MSAIGTAGATGQQVIIHQRAGLRTALRVAAGAAAAGSLGYAAWMVRAEDPARPKQWAAVLAGGASSAALVGLAALLPAKRAPIVAGGFAGLDDAVRAADQLDREAGVIRRGGTHSIVDLHRYYDLDRGGLDTLRIGDGSVRFDALITRDGDLLKPLSPTKTTGYANHGAAKPPLDLRTLDPRKPDKVEAALRGRQLATDDDHDRLLIGAMVGSRNGYASAKDAAAAVYTPGGPEHAVLEVGNRSFAFALDGPPQRLSNARGTAVGPWPNVHVQDTKGLYRPPGAGEEFAFEQRVLPFTLDEPIGRKLWLRDHNGTPAAHVSAHSSAAGAEGEARRRGRDSRDWNGFGVVQGATASGDFHVYRLGGDAYRGWDEELGTVHAVQYAREGRRRVRESWNPDYIQFQERDELWHVERARAADRLKSSNWNTDHVVHDPERRQIPTYPGGETDGW